jgi:hypothetical protein
MRYSIAIVLVAFTFAGCAESRRQTALQVWNSADATLEQRAHAVSQVVPIGSSQKTVTSILGTNGGWAHFYGPTVDTLHTPPHQLPDTDIWCLLYKFPGGGVQLFFDPPTAFGDRFVRAAPYKILFTTTNVQPNTALEPTPTAP